MGSDAGKIMVVRLTPPVGLLGLFLVLLRLQRLVRPTPEGLDWRLAAGGALLLGIAVGLTAGLLRARWAFIALAAAGVSLLVDLRFAVPDTLRQGLLPTLATWPPLSAQLAEGWEQVRFGTAPIHPGPELLLVLFPVFISLGTLWGASTAKRQGWLGLVGTGWFYLLLAVIDRSPAGSWLIASTVWVGAGVVAVRLDNLRTDARLLGSASAWAPVASTAVAIIGAIILVSSPAASFPGSGLLPWRDASTLGGVRTGVSYNLFASTIQSDLVAQSEVAVFEARIGPSPVAPEDTYWRLITLDRYDGTHWVPTPGPASIPGAEVDAFESEGQRFRGSTESVLASVRIAALRQNFLPFLGSPTDIDSSAPILRSGFRTRPDGSIKLDGLTRQGLEYVLTADVPAVDVLSLATELSADDAPVLREAAAAGFITLSGTGQVTLPDLPDRSLFLQLPFDLDPRIQDLASSIVEPAGTPLEGALLLESWFRTPGRFTYSVDIEPGHAASDLAAWLFETDSPNHRVGYCEQFATAMAVMARSQGIPARVVLGFAPGDLGEDGLVTVREKHGHAWVEVWLDGVGWVGFDPTPRTDGINPASATALGFDILAVADTIILPEPTEAEEGLAPLRDVTREGLEEDVATPDALTGDTLPGFGGGAGLAIPDGASWVLAAIGSVAAIPLFKRARRGWRLRRARNGDIRAAWNEITDHLRDSGFVITGSMTPREVSGLVGAAVGPLTRAYQQNEYGSTPPTRTQRLEAIESLVRVEAELRDRPWRERVITSWRLRSLRHTR